MTGNPRIDAYIESRQPFARPILSHVRALVDAAAPELAEEFKWSHPAFTLNGKLVLGMAAFKEHAILNFWHGALVTGGTGVEDQAMGSFGRIASLRDLPPDDELKTMIAKAARLAAEGVKAPHVANRQKREALPVPPVLQAALDANPAAAEAWAGFTGGQRREYNEWIGEAKREETAAKRAAEAVGWIAEGKKRNWKYEKC